MITAVFQHPKTCILLPLFVVLMTAQGAHANDNNGGILDNAVIQDNRGASVSAARQQATTAVKDQKALEKLVRQELKELEKLSRQNVKALADKGERLAQVTLASDFADEAQMLTFAPAAANAALSDAVRWYSLAAQRGFPGSPAIDTSGAGALPLRVVRNR